jgi:hypothetical protein
VTIIGIPILFLDDPYWAHFLLNLGVTSWQWRDSALSNVTLMGKDAQLACFQGKSAAFVVQNIPEIAPIKPGLSL